MFHSRTYYELHDSRLYNCGGQRYYIISNQTFCSSLISTFLWSGQVSMCRSGLVTLVNVGYVICSWRWILSFSRWYRPGEILFVLSHSWGCEYKGLFFMVVVLVSFLILGTHRFLTRPSPIRAINKPRQVVLPSHAYLSLTSPPVTTCQPVTLPFLTPGPGNIIIVLNLLPK